MTSGHTPVLLQEVIEGLSPEPGRIFIDGTAGAGGHTFALWERVKPSGQVLAIDRDLDAVRSLTQRATALDAKGVIVAHDSYAKMRAIADSHSIDFVDGVVLDLGLSSSQLMASGRGFSFSASEGKEPLDMRFDTNQELTAAQGVNTYSREQMATILSEYGEERYARQIAQGIANRRKSQRIITTGELVAVIETVVPEWYRNSRIHPATKSFQALRIEVNQELKNLESGLSQALEVLKIGGRVAVISFHSLEDRMVKQFFRNESKAQHLSIIT